MFESKLACMKENQLVWKRMTLYERKWASVKVTVNPLLSTRLAKPHPANARQTTWTQRHPGILHHSSLQLHRACPGQGVWSGHFGRDHFQLHKEVEELFLYSNSDYYLPQKYLESEVLQRRRKEGARFSATKWPIWYFLDIHHLQLRFSGSAHVQHLRKHPKKYEEAVVEFLKRTMSVVEEEEEVGSWIAWLNLGISPKIG